MCRSLMSNVMKDSSGSDLHIEAVVRSVLFGPGVSGFFPGHSSLHTDLQQSERQPKILQ